MGADPNLRPPLSQRTPFLRGLCLLLVLSGLAPASAPAGQWTLSGSLGFSTGDYGQSETTETWSLFAESTYRSEKWRIGAGLPLFQQDSSLLQPVVSSPTHPGGGMTHQAAHLHPPEHVPTPESDSRNDVELGDLVLWGEVVPSLRLPTGFHLSALALAKVPTADEETGSGTGEWDVGGGARLGWGYGLSWATLDLLYWKLGDPPGRDFRDVVSGTLILGRRTYDGPWHFEGVLRGRTSTTESTESAAALGGTAWRWTSPRSRLGLGADVGLTDGAPDLSVRLTWTSDRWPERWLPGSTR